MLRKWIGLLALCLALAGCSSGGISPDEYQRVVAERDELRTQLDKLQRENSESVVADTSKPDRADNESSAPPPGVFDSDSVANQIEIREVGTYENSIGTKWTALVLQNNSGYLIDIDVNVTFTDDSGQLIGAKSKSETAFEPGSQIALMFNNEAFHDSYDCALSVKESRYEGVMSKIIYEVSPTGNKAIITATNTSELPARFAEYTALFFSNGEFVYHDSGYCTDGDSELKPGKSISKEANARRDFDAVDVYFTGRG